VTRPDLQLIKKETFRTIAVRGAARFLLVSGLLPGKTQAVQIRGHILCLQNKTLRIVYTPSFLAYAETMDCRTESKLSRIPARGNQQRMSGAARMGSPGVRSDRR
jgi:hypothetical protein